MDNWRKVEELGSIWLISRVGQVKTPEHSHQFERIRFGKSELVAVTYPQRDLTPYVNAKGYYEVAATKAGKRVRVLLHRLLARAYVPGYAPEMTVNHINGDKLDNRLTNLEWISRNANSVHQWETGLLDLNGENSASAKLTTKQVLILRELLLAGIATNKLADLMNLSPASIRKIRDRITWKSVEDH